MQGRRHDRVRELLKRELGLILQRELPAAEAGVASVNEVHVSGDFRSAVVYVGFVGDAATCERGWAMLRERRAHVQELLGRALVMKHTPRLKFVLDHAIERGTRVLQIIEQLEAEQSPDESS
ncbi:MAG: 30S ribosome-binding factor RbfA [Verrucomicrobia bacterium]|nr:MAG: 30S ribosome-binding factor RbfA [Verrucomicrobiota bacterium]